MRLLRMFIINFQRVLEHRTSNFVWLLISIINPLILLVYWVGYYKSQGTVDYSSISSITSYYLILAFVSSLLMVHIEGDVANNDIQLGGLSSYLLRPFSYITAKFIYELPWRLIQSLFALFAVLAIYFLFPSLIKVNLSFVNILATSIIFVLAYIISFYFKMIMGLLAFWLVEFSGFEQFIAVFVLCFAGYVMPIDFFPDLVKKIAYLTPLPYIIYYPVISLQGKIPVSNLFSVISAQIIWITILKMLLSHVWNKGMKKFSGVGD